MTPPAVPHQTIVDEVLRDLAHDARNRPYLDALRQYLGLVLAEDAMGGDINLRERDRNLHPNVLAARAEARVDTAGSRAFLAANRLLLPRDVLLRALAACEIYFWAHQPIPADPTLKADYDNVLTFFERLGGWQLRQMTRSTDVFKAGGFWSPGVMNVLHGVPVAKARPAKPPEPAAPPPPAPSKPGGRPPALTDEQRAKALRMRAEGTSNADIARSLGVSRSTISRL